MSNLEIVEYHFAKDCAYNYEKGVEFSIRLTWGPVSRTINVPRNSPELDGLSNKKKRERFLNILYDFYELMDAAGENDSNYQLKIQYLPLQSPDYSYTIATFSKGGVK